MPIDVTWHSEDRSLMLVRYHGVWDWTDFHGAYDNAERELRARTDAVYVVHLMETGSSGKGASLSHLRRPFTQLPRAVRKMILVPSQKGSLKLYLIRRMAIAAAIFKRQAVTIANSYEEAMALIAADRAAQAGVAATEG